MKKERKMKINQAKFSFSWKWSRTILSSWNKNENLFYSKTSTLRQQQQQQSDEFFFHSFLLLSVNLFLFLDVGRDTSVERTFRYFCSIIFFSIKHQYLSHISSFSSTVYIVKKRRVSCIMRSIVLLCELKICVTFR